MRPGQLPRPSRTRTVAALAALALILGAVGGLPSPAAALAAPIDGPQTSGDSLFPNVGNGGYDVAHYDIDLAWTPAAPLAQSTIDATTSITAATTGDPLQSFSFDFLHPTMTIESLTVNGTPATFESVQDAEAIKHKLVVTPAAPVEGTFTTVVEYSGIPTRYQDPDNSYEGWMATPDGATFVNQPIGAMTLFPNNNTPADKATYTIDVDIPNEIGGGPAAAASNGELTKVVGETRTDWQWEQLRPMATELVMISIGRYDVLESDVTLASGRTLHEWSFVDSGYSQNAKNAINLQRARWKSVLDGLESIYGPYPGNSIGIVVDTVPDVNYALETQDRSFFQTSVNAGTFVHEAAHQWYGNNVSPTEWNDLYINEGMATWAPTFFNNEAVDPPTSASTTAGTYFLSWNNLPASNAQWTIPPAGMTDPAILYEYQSYTRGAQMWEALRQSIGDQAFFAFVREWQDRFGGESRGTEAFIDLAEELSGRDLTAFFQDWVFDGDKPAWPQRYDLTLTDEATSTPLAPGESVTYSLTATNKGFVPLTSSVAEVDLTDVLDDATVDDENLPGALSLDGAILTWAIPSTARNGRQTVSFTAVVDDASTDSALVATAASRTLGGHCTPGSSCRSELAVPAAPVEDTPDPSLSGLERVGRTLAVDTGEWDGTTAVRWFRNTRPISGATGETYTLIPADLGKDVVARVTYGDTGYTSVSKDAVATDVLPGVFTLRPVPRITGRARVGELLTAVPGTHNPGVQVRYQWLADGDAIAGATGRTFRIPARYRGDYIRVRTTASKVGYLTLTKTSAATAKVV